MNAAITDAVVGEIQHFQTCKGLTLKSVLSKVLTASIVDKIMRDIEQFNEADLFGT